MERYNNTNAFCHLDDEQEGDLRQWEYLTHTFDNDQFNDTSSVPVFPCPTSETELALHRHHCHNHSLPFNNPSLSPMKFYHVSDLQRFNSCINSCVTSNTCVTVVVPNRVDHINTSASVSLQNDECMVGSTALFLSSTSPNSSATSTSKTNKQVASTARAVTNSANISSGNIARGENTKMLKLCKPMKVYNYFYRNERDNIVNGMKQPGDPLPPPVSDFSQTKFEKLLHQRW